MRVLGIDGGIASIGWAMIELDGDSGAVLAAGVRTFDAPETDKDKTPSNSVRRATRGQRRVIRRRRQRMTCLRGLFVAEGLLPSADRDALRRPGFDPWQLRAEGLERCLEPAEFAVALGHIARHRGFPFQLQAGAGRQRAERHVGHAGGHRRHARTAQPL